MPKTKHHPSLARPIAAEDLRPGLYVAILYDLVETYLPGCEEPHRPRLEYVRLRFLPDERPPLKVVDVCLPLVLAREPDGSLRTLDARQHRFARLDRDFGRRVFRALAPSRPRKQSRRK